MTGPRITEVSLSLAPFIASAGSSPDFNRIGWIAPPFPESWRTVDSGLRFPSVQVTYLMTVIQFCGRPSTLPLTNQLQPSTSKTDKKLLRFFKKFWNIKKASASTLETEVIFQYTKSVVNAKTAAPDYSDTAVKLLQMCDFGGILPTSTQIGTRWHTAQLFCIIIMQKTLQTRQTFELFSPAASLSGTAAHRG